MIVKNKYKYIAISSLLIITTNTFAKKYPSIYPFVPYKTEKVLKQVEKIAEDDNILSNFFSINDKSLSNGKAKVQPWGSTFWPLNKGLIADPYESTFVGYYVEVGTVSWKRNYAKYKARHQYLLNNIDNYSSEQLNFLAPSEKYDLLLGDKSFDLTTRLWDYMQKWGSQKEYGFLSNLDLTGEKTILTAQKLVERGWFESLEDAFLNAYELQGSIAVDKALALVKQGAYENIEQAMPEAIDQSIIESENYVLKKKNNLIAFWEGICHGWATSAGIVARPRNTIAFELPDGREIKFYPTDIKALVSLLWANSLIQNNKFVDEQTGENIGGGVISQGLRCNLKSPQKDVYGRLYDHEPDPFNGDHSPRCSGVHPAIWHLSLVNIIGVQGRSFVVERKVGDEVDNHPMSSYSFKYFNPYKGRSKRNIEDNIELITEDDVFINIRNPDARYIVGVEAKMRYIDWERPVRYLVDNETYDNIETKKMFYDLELDKNYNIVGGQWRALKKYSPRVRPDSKNFNHNQPDFFWIITKDWKNFFQNIAEIEPWNDTSKAPPASWKEYALNAHKFIYHKKFSYGTGEKCKVYNKVTKKYRDVSCEFEEPRPQPLVNLVNKLVELAK